MEIINYSEEHKIFRESLKKFLDREVVPPIEEWEEAGSPGMYERAHARAKDILENHKPEPLPDDVRQRVRDIVAREDKAAGRA